MNWCCSFFMVIWIWIRNIQGKMMMIVFYFSVLRCFIVAVIFVSVWFMRLLGMTKLRSVV